MTTTTMTATATPAHKAGLTPIRPPLVTRAFAVRADARVMDKMQK